MNNEKLAEQAKIEQCKKRIWIIAAIGFAVFFILLTLLFGKVPQTNTKSPRLIDWLANWIFHFQPILAAIVATIGVYFTIKEMNKNNRDILYSGWNRLVFDAMKASASINSLAKIQMDIYTEAQIPTKDDHRLKTITNLNALH